MRKETNVMVLDDEIIVGERLRPMLEREGFSVDVSTDGFQDIERIKQKSYSVLVTDMKMQGFSGMDVLRFVKKHASVDPGHHDARELLCLIKVAVLTVHVDDP